MKGLLVQGVTLPLSNGSWERLQQTQKFREEQVMKMDGWMNKNVCQMKL